MSDEQKSSISDINSMMKKSTSKVSETYERAIEVMEKENALYEKKDIADLYIENAKEINQLNADIMRMIQSYNF